VELLLKYGAWPDFEDQYELTSLSQAVMKSEETVVELLVKYGAPRGLKNGFRWTLLSQAVEHGSATIVQQLLPQQVKMGFSRNIVR